jgi:hypothetical protein
MTAQRRKCAVDPAGFLFSIEDGRSRGPYGTKKTGRATPCISENEQEYSRYKSGSRPNGGVYRLMVEGSSIGLSGVVD